MEIRPKGYRILNKIHRLPSGIIENIINYFDYFKSIQSASIEDLDEVEGIGEIRATYIKNGLIKMEKMASLICKYNKFSLNQKILYMIKIRGGEVLIKKNNQNFNTILGLALGTTTYVNLSKIVPAISFGMQNIYLPAIVAGIVFGILFYLIKSFIFEKVKGSIKVLDKEISKYPQSDIL